MCGLDYSFADRPTALPSSLCASAISAVFLTLRIDGVFAAPRWVHLVNSLPFLLATCIFASLPLKGGLVAGQYVFRADEEGKLIRDPRVATRLNDGDSPMARTTRRGNGMRQSAEITSFRMKPGITAKDAVEAGRDIDAWLRRQPGFVSRLMIGNADGTITDIVVWKTERDGRASSGRLMAETASSRFHELVDGGSVDWSFDDVLI